MTVSEAIEKLKFVTRHKGLRKATLDVMNRELATVEKHFGALDLEAIDYNVLDSFVEEHGTPKFNTAKYFNKLCKFSFDRGYVGKRPPSMTGKKPGKRGRVLDDDEIERLWQHSRGEMRVFVALGVYCGMRRGEITSLDWNEVDMERGTITVLAEKCKTKRRRAFPFGSRPREALEALRHRSGSVIRRPIRQAWDVLRRRAEVNARAHDMRHSFLTRAALKIKAGKISPAKITSYAGLTFKVLEETYLHVTLDDLEEMRDIV